MFELVQLTCLGVSFGLVASGCISYRKWRKKQSKRKLLKSVSFDEESQCSTFDSRRQIPLQNCNSQKFDIFHSKRKKPNLPPRRFYSFPNSAEMNERSNNTSRNDRVHTFSGEVSTQRYFSEDDHAESEINDINDAQEFNKGKTELESAYTKVYNSDATENQYDSDESLNDSYEYVDVTCYNRFSELSHNEKYAETSHNEKYGESSHNEKFGESNENVDDSIPYTTCRESSPYATCQELSPYATCKISNSSATCQESSTNETFEETSSNVKFGESSLTTLYIELSPNVTRQESIPFATHRKSSHVATCRESYFEEDLYLDSCVAVNDENSDQLEKNQENISQNTEEEAYISPLVYTNKRISADVSLAEIKERV